MLRFGLLCDDIFGTLHGRRRQTLKKNAQGELEPKAPSAQTNHHHHIVGVALVSFVSFVSLVVFVAPFLSGGLFLWGWSKLAWLGNEEDSIQMNEGGRFKGDDIQSLSFCPLASHPHHSLASMRENANIKINDAGKN